MEHSELGTASRNQILGIFVGCVFTMVRTIVKKHAVGTLAIRGQEVEEDLAKETDQELQVR